MGVEQVQDPILQIDQDLLDVLCGMNPVGDVQKGLAGLEPLFKLGDGDISKGVCHGISVFPRSPRAAMLSTAREGMRP